MPPRYEDDRIGRLEAATERLSQNVIGLSTSLSIVTEITQRQSDVEERAALAEHKAFDIEKTTAAVQLAIKEVQDSRRRARVFTIIGTICVLGLIAYVRYESVVQISDRIKASYRACLNTNERVETQAQIVEGDKRDAVRNKLAQKLRSQETDCVKLFGPDNIPGFFG